MTTIADTRETPLAGLRALQESLEEEALELGKQRYWKELSRKGHEESMPARRLLKATVVPMIDAINSFIAAAASGKAGRRSTASMYLSLARPEALALLAIRAILHGLIQRAPVMHVAHLIGSLVKEHLEWTGLQEAEPGLVFVVGKKLDKSTSERHRRAVIRHVVQKFGTGHSLQWNKRAIEMVGMALVDLVITSTGLVQMVQQSEGRKRTPKYLVATDEVTKLLEDAHARCELLHPLYYPMVCRPRKWTTPFNGGYLLRRNALVKRADQNYLEELKHVHMPDVYRAINALQNTAWRINSGVLAVLEEAWASGSTAALPPRDDEPLPAKPEDIATNKDARREWRHKAALTYAANASLVGKRIGVVRKLALAQQFKDVEKLYFPHSLDWRGRAYPIPTDITPQGDDLGRGLLRFAEGKPLGESGPYWLAVHIANCFGVDKVSFDDRVKWVQDNEADILDSAMRPLDGKQFWCGADKPWQALAGCFEWLGYSLQGEEYVSSLPIAMDGSCNGLQNFSAMLRDEVGGAATNLVPSDKPQDIYQLVADTVQRKLQSVYAGAPGLVELWLAAGVTRGLMKRPVMTLPYGVTRYGMREQVMTEVRRAGLLEGNDIFDACIFLANIIYDSIGEVVVAAHTAMGWLQDAASVVAKNGLPVRWVSPVGFPVLQAYRKHKTKRMKVFIGGRRVYFNFREDSSAIDVKKQTLGISPNFVHSCDAAHMMATVNLALFAGMSSFGMVHDSYATLACDVDQMGSLLRQAFVEQYSKDVLGTFRRELVEQLPAPLAEQIAPLPPMGTLDVAAVMDSLYFFA